ncbi:MAG: hypothetical protein WB973_23320, partial [Thermoanaerobaculia bacterium]
MRPIGIDGDHRSIKRYGEITKGEKHVRGNASGFSLFDQRNPTGWTTIHSDDIGHALMIRANAAGEAGVRT